MRKQPLTTRGYTAGMKDLSSHDLATYGNQIVSAPVALALLSAKAGRELNRSTIVQMCRYGHVRPFGKYRNTYYFWRRDIEHIQPQTRRNKAKETVT